VLFLIPDRAQKTNNNVNQGIPFPSSSNEYYVIKKKAKPNGKPPKVCFNFWKIETLSNDI
jgi:hypothetical protein